MRIKSKDIAEALGISPSTVSLVLNDRPGVNPATRRRVQKYLEQLEKKNNSKRRAESPESKGTVLMLNYIKHGMILKQRKDLSIPTIKDTNCNWR